ncbi:hypothetical protein ACSQ67_009834 [Phaseolus vulgaris]
MEEVGCSALTSSNHNGGGRFGPRATIMEEVDVLDLNLELPEWRRKGGENYFPSYILTYLYFLFPSKMAHSKKVLMKMILLFVVLLSMNMATARVPLWNSDPHKPHGRLLGDRARNHNYDFPDDFPHGFPDDFPHDFPDVHNK